MFKIEVQVSGKDQAAYNKLSLMISDFCAELRIVDPGVQTFIDGTFNPHKDDITIPVAYELDPPLGRRGLD
jgi:hypothetical protein